MGVTTVVMIIWPFFLEGANRATRRANFAWELTKMNWLASWWLNQRTHSALITMGPTGQFKCTMFSSVFSRPLISLLDQLCCNLWRIECLSSVCCPNHNSECLVMFGIASGFPPFWIWSWIALEQIYAWLFVQVIYACEHPVQIKHDYCPLINALINFLSYSAFSWLFCSSLWALRWMGRRFN